MSYESTEDRVERLEKYITGLDHKLAVVTDGLKTLTERVAALGVLVQINDYHLSKGIIAHSSLLSDDVRRSYLEMVSKALSDIQLKSSDLLSKIAAPGPSLNDLLPPLPYNLDR